MSYQFYSLGRLEKEPGEKKRGDHCGVSPQGKADRHRPEKKELAAARGVLESFTPYLDVLETEREGARKGFKELEKTKRMRLKSIPRRKAKHSKTSRITSAMAESKPEKRGGGNFGGKKNKLLRTGRGGKFVLRKTTKGRDTREEKGGGRKG